MGVAYLPVLATDNCSRFPSAFDDDRDDAVLLRSPTRRYGSRVAIPELVRRGAVKKVEAYCDARVPKAARDQVRVEVGVRASALTIVERRPPWSGEIGSEWTTSPIAQLRYDEATAMWTVYWADRNGRWLRYPDAEPAASIEMLIAAIENDRSGAFFG